MPPIDDDIDAEARDVVARLVANLRAGGHDDASVRREVRYQVDNMVADDDDPWEAEAWVAACERALAELVPPIA